jgi:hypothetical protein
MTNERPGGGRQQGGTEPTLREMLEDPVVKAVMSVDNVSAEEILRLMEQARERLAAQ